MGFWKWFGFNSDRFQETLTISYWTGYLKRPYGFVYLVFVIKFKVLCNKKLYNSTVWNLTQKYLGNHQQIFTRANKIDWIWRVSDYYRRMQVRYWLLWIWVCPPALHLSRAWTRPTLFHFSSDINLNKIVFPNKEKTQTIKVTFLTF